MCVCADDYISLAQLLPELLQQREKGAFRRKRRCRAIIMLDSLDQLSDDDNGRLLQWLPMILPRDIHIIVRFVVRFVVIGVLLLFFVRLS